MAPAQHTTLNLAANRAHPCQAGYVERWALRPPGIRHEPACGDARRAGIRSGCKARYFSVTICAMGARGGMAAASMQSHVNWALLGLVIERPSYAYELAQRFERTYDGSLALSSVSHVYTALRALQDRGL